MSEELPDHQFPAVTEGQAFLEQAWETQRSIVWPPLPEAWKEGKLIDFPPCLHEEIEIPSSTEPAE